MKNNKPPIKLFTWKYGIFIGAILILVVALKLYHDYKQKGYVDGSDLMSAIAPLTLLILIVLGIAYWAKHSEKRK